MREGAGVQGGGDGDDADGVLGGQGGGFEEGGEQELREEGVAEVVNAELGFVAFGCEGGGREGDAGVVVEDVEAGGLGQDGGGGGFGAFEGGEVEFDGGDVGGGVVGFDVGDQGLGAGWVAGAEVDAGWVVGGEFADCLCTKAGIACRCY